jgi:hypothetical protein
MARNWRGLCPAVDYSGLMMMMMMMMIVLQSERLIASDVKSTEQQLANINSSALKYKTRIFIIY